jgi:hypothetical protein
VAALTSRLSEYRRRVARIQNRAIFEIPEILERILEAEQPQPCKRPAPQISAAAH